MNNKIIKIISLISLGFVVSTYNACSSPYSSQTASSEEAYLAASVQAFSENLHGTLQNQCSQCHGVFQEPLFAVEDASSAHEAVMSRSLVDLSRPGASYFITKLSEGHNNFGQNVIDEISSGIQAWARIMEEYEELNPQPDPGSVIEFNVADDESVLSKVKFLVHGGAVTNAEFQEYMSASDKRAALMSMVDTWVETEEGQGKLLFLLGRALNQDFITNSDLFDDGEIGDLSGSMRQSFARTALDIIDRDRPLTRLQLPADML